MSATAHDQIPRNSLAWMLAANLAAIAPHVTRLPIWLIGICGVCLLYRVMVFRGVWSFPNKWWCAFLVLSGGASIFVHYGMGLGPEAGVALLIMSFAMKMLEMHRFRDAYLQVILAYFVVATEFLFNSSVYVTLYLYGVMLMITAALIGLNQSSQSLWQMLRLSFFLSLQALPIMLMLFIFFPRLSPLWALDMTGPTQTAGLRDSMTPADIAQLGRTDRRAFRAEFSGTIPPQEQLYWRGLVFSEFDGRTWSVIQDLSPTQRSYTLRQLDVSVEQPSVEYSVMLEPTDQTHLFALDMPQVYQSDIVLNRDFTLSSSKPIVQPLIYQLRSFLQYRAQPVLTDRQRVRELQLPVDTNLRSQALAQQWMGEVGDDPEQLTQKILQWFHEEKFVYTLSPPVLKDNIVDRFLFETKEGYCSFYAGALVFLLRSAGVPSRVVVGYMGGEVNPLGHYVVVNQYDAHAWAEVWIADKGWIRVDPTAAVAPQRIRDSVQRGLSEQADFLKDYPLSMARYRHSALLRQVWRSFDYASFSWQRFVVGYDGEKQQEIFKRFFEDANALWLSLMVLAVVLVILGIIAWFILRTGSPGRADELNRAYQYFCDVCAKQGLIRKPQETPNQFARRLQPAMPTQSAQIDEITQLYVQQQYQLPTSAAAKHAAVRRIREVARRLLRDG
jgi:hypothetical protein